MTSYFQNYKSHQPQILHQECFYGCNDSCKVSFQLVDVNLDFGIRASEPPGAWRTTEKAGSDRVKIQYTFLGFNTAL